MTFAIFITAAITFVAMCLTSVFLNRTHRLKPAFWTELLAVIPAMAALAAAAANDAAGWVIGVWVFNGASAVLSAWFISKRIRADEEERAAAAAWADRFLR